MSENSQEEILFSLTHSPIPKKSIPNQSETQQSKSLNIPLKILINEKPSNRSNTPRIASQNERRVSCHRCGNIRKRKIICEQKSCPHIFCGRCGDKMKEEHGENVFVGGCPVCRELCCCNNKTLYCSRKNHCYRKCPASKVKSLIGGEQMSSPSPPGALDLLAVMADVHSSKKRQRLSRTSMQYLNQSLSGGLGPGVGASQGVDHSPSTTSPPTLQAGESEDEGEGEGEGGGEDVSGQLIRQHSESALSAAVTLCGLVSDTRILESFSHPLSSSDPSHSPSPSPGLLDEELDEEGDENELLNCSFSSQSSTSSTFPPSYFSLISPHLVLSSESSTSPLPTFSVPGSPSSLPSPSQFLSASNAFFNASPSPSLYPQSPSPFLSDSLSLLSTSSLPPSRISSPVNYSPAYSPLSFSPSYSPLSQSFSTRPSRSFSTSRLSSSPPSYAHSRTYSLGQSLSPSSSSPSSSLSPGSTSGIGVAGRERNLRNRPRAKTLVETSLPPTSPSQFPLPPLSSLYSDLNSFSLPPHLLSSSSFNPSYFTSPSSTPLPPPPPPPTPLPPDTEYSPLYSSLSSSLSSLPSTSKKTRSLSFGGVMVEGEGGGGGGMREGKRRNRSSSLSLYLPPPPSPPHFASPTVSFESDHPHPPPPPHLPFSSSISSSFPLELVKEEEEQSDPSLPLPPPSTLDFSSLSSLSALLLAASSLPPSPSDPLLPSPSLSPSTSSSLLHPQSSEDEAETSILGVGTEILGVGIEIDVEGEGEEERDIMGVCTTVLSS